MTMTEYIKRKCYEIRDMKDEFYIRLNSFQERVMSLGKSYFWMDGIVEMAGELVSYYTKVNEAQFHVKQMIWMMENEEYKKLWNEIVEGEA